MHVGIKGVLEVVGNFVFCEPWESGGWGALTMGQGVPLAKVDLGQSRTAGSASGMRVGPPSFCTHPCHVHGGAGALVGRVPVGPGWVVGGAAPVEMAHSSE